MDIFGSQLVVEELNPLWGNKSLLKLASNAKFKSFIAHPCCQDVLESVWCGNVSIHDDAKDGGPEEV